MQVECKVLDEAFYEEFPLPTYASTGAAALDLRACLPEDKVIEPNQTLLIGTGLSVLIKDPRVAATIIPRSGLGHKNGIVLGNLMGLIDSDYQGQLFISCWNRSDKPFVIQRGERLAQLMFIPVIQVKLLQVNEFTNTERGEGGFGHSGRL